MATMRERQRAVQLYRGQIPSPGRPTVAWRRGPGPVLGGDRSRGEDRGRGGGGRACHPPVGFRWFRHAGGVNPCLPPTVSGRYLSFAEREDIAHLRTRRGLGVREIARRLSRHPSTISRELRRNASTRTWRLDYKASIAQWHAERRARRPKVAKLVTNERLRDYVQDRLAGVVRASDGAPVRARTGRSGRAATSRTARIAGGRRPGARSRSRTGCGSTSPMMSPCGSATRRSTRRSTCRAAARSSASWSPVCAPGGRCGFLELEPASKAWAPRHPGGDDQRAARRGRRPRRPRPLGRRPAHRARTLRDRHARRAHDAVHDADPPATRGRLRHRASRSRTAPRWPATARITMKNALASTMTTAARAAAPITDLGPRQGTLPARRSSRSRPASRSTSPTRTAPGSAARTRTPTACCASTSPRAPTCRAGAADEIEAVAAALNSRPRKTLGWKTPAEALDEHLRSLQQAGVATTT